jgi:phenylacetate-CoA ligase
MLLRKLWYLQKARKFQWKPKHQIRESQLIGLRRIINYAYHNVPYYNLLFTKAKLDPKSIRRVADLTQIPLLNKEDIRNNFRALLSREYEVGQCVSRFTSGSSGMPLTVLYDAAAWDFAEAIYARALFNVGIKPWSRCAFFWAEPFPKFRFYERMGLMQKNYVSTTRNVDYQIKQLNRIKPSVLYTFPSSLRILVKHYLNGAIKTKPSIIVCTGELLPGKTKREFEEIFGCKVFDQYGTQEFNRMGWTCGCDEGFHIDEDAIVIEFVKDNEQVSEGEVGSMVVTGLFNRAMPLIRYNLGDIGSAERVACRCGRGLSLMKILEGRSDSLITLPSGRILGPRAITGVFDHLMLHSNKVLIYRLVQKTKSKFELYLVKGDRFDDGTVESILSSLQILIGEPVNIQTRIVSDLARTKGGKFRYVFSEVKPVI